MVDPNGEGSQGPSRRGREPPGEGGQGGACTAGRGVAGSRLRRNGNKRRHKLNTSNMRSVDIILHTPPLPNPIVPQKPKTLSYQFLTNCHVLGLVGGGPKPPPHLDHLPHAYHVWG